MATTSNKALVMVNRKIILGKRALVLTSISFFLLTAMCEKANPTSGDGTIGTMTDIDGNVYKTVKIGTQCWTVENMRTTKYNDNTPISYVSDSSAWHDLYATGSTTGAYCFYENNSANIAKYGALYNWHAVNTEKLAPVGWHVPTDAEWDTLQNYLIANGYNYDGSTIENKIAKSLAAQSDWHTDTTTGSIGCDLTKNNKSGFLALPGGFRDYDGKFFNQGYYGYWWSTTKDSALDRGLGYRYEDGFYRDDFENYDESCGFSVRLLRN